jgi:hypothetical protein
VDVSEEKAKQLLKDFPKDFERTVPVDVVAEQADAKVQRAVKKIEEKEQEILGPSKVEEEPVAPKVPRAMSASSFPKPVSHAKKRKLKNRR